MSSLPEDEVLFQRNNRAGVVLLNRPKALNSLNLNMISTMLSTLQSWNTDPDIDIIIAKGAGGKAFCAGGDVVALCKASKTGEELTKEFFYKEYQLDYATSMGQLVYGLSCLFNRPPFFVCYLCGGEHAA
jgi:enoyl-CoA hydratase/carnithine racemase